MTDEVAYRGPDDRGSVFFGYRGGVWTDVGSEDSHWTAAFGHRRLSILDLSPSGHQPMSYRGRFWITYNGEVYNFIELRAELEKLGHEFCSSSDTEVILAAYAEWGPACFERLRGMWGFAILDCVNRVVIVCRDRLGIKPLYLWEGDGIVAAASEIKQFLHVPGFKARLNPQAAAEYLQTGYENPTGSLFRDVVALRGGTWRSIPLNTLKIGSEESYWNPERIQVAVSDPEEAGRLLSDKLSESVRIHLRSDVPVGCALSGGLDSSSIAVLVNRLHEGGNGFKLHTFTSTFPGDPLDEREYVDSVLDEINSEPHFVTPDVQGFLDDLDRFLWIHDEPVGSFSMYAAYCVARLARQCGVPVTLNGQGGDEILSGYWQTYFLHLRDLWKEGQVGELCRHFAGACSGVGNPALLNQIPLMFERYRARSKPSLPVCFPGAEIRNDGRVLRNVLSMERQARRVHEIRVMFLPQLLKWDDRNFMAFSVEGRYPFLDHELIELCLSFTPQTLYKFGWTKRPLRIGLRGILPSKILERRSKFGFETPHDRWLSGPLRNRLNDWMNKERPIWEHVDPKVVHGLSEAMSRNGKRGKTHAGETLFRIYLFDKWMEIFGVQS